MLNLKVNSTNRIVYRYDELDNIILNQWRLLFTSIDNSNYIKDASPSLVEYHDTENWLILYFIEVDNLTENLALGLIDLRDEPGQYNLNIYTRELITDPWIEVNIEMCIVPNINQIFVY